LSQKKKNRKDRGREEEREGGRKEKRNMPHHFKVKKARNLFLFVSAV
jgi:hypothetical protein